MEQAPDRWLGQTIQNMLVLMWRSQNN